MAKKTSKFVCQQCGYQSPSYLGRCPNCQAWESFVEEVQSSASPSINKGKSGTKAVNLSDIKAQALNRQTTKIGELDLVLGGGVVPGMVTLLSGEPGIGKSTLLLELAKNWPDKVIYVAGEESPIQIKIRATRLGIDVNHIVLLEETDVDTIINYLDSEPEASLVIVDSIQTLTTGDLEGMAGTVGQVRESSGRLIASLKPKGIPLFLVGHVTKEGTIAGPKVLEHAVDAILHLEGEKFTPLRLLRGQKNRFGPTDETGIFEMTDKGIAGADPSQLTNTESRSGTAPGSCLTIAMEGTRPVLVEVQALVTSTPLPNPRRVASGVNYNRLLTVLAILQKRLNIPLYKEDIYVSVSGGLKLDEPAADLPMAMAILSSYRNKAVPPRTLAIGELDLLGNIRAIPNLARRIKEAKKLGFTKVVSAETAKSLSNVSL